MPQGVNVTITAEDQASAVAQQAASNIRGAMLQLQRDSQAAMEGASGAVARSSRAMTEEVGKLGRGVREVTQIFDAMGGEALYRLSPGLARAADSFSLAAREARNLSVGVGGAILAANLVGSAAAAFIDTWQKSAEAVRQYNLALQSADVGRVAEQHRLLKDRLEGNVEALQKLRQELAGLASEDRTMTGAILGARIERVRAGMAQAARVAEALRGRGEVEGEAGVGAVTGAQEAARLSAAQKLQAAQRYGLDPIGRAYLDALDAISELAKTLDTSPQSREVVAHLRAAAAGQRSFARDLAGARLFTRSGLPETATGDEGGDVFGVGGQAAVRELMQGLDAKDIQRGTLFARTPFRTTETATGDEVGEFFGTSAAALVRETLQGLAERQLDRDAALARTAPDRGVSDYDGALFGEAGQAQAMQALDRIEAASVERRRESLGLERQRVDLLGQAVGLTAQERDALDLSVSANREALRIAQEQAALARATEPEAAIIRQRIALIQQEEASRRTMIAQGALERDSPTAGLAAGFRMTVDEFGAAGAQMQGFARSTAEAMRSAFSEGFFDVLTGQFKALPDVARQASAQMLRAVTDAIAGPLTAQLLSPLRDLFRGSSTFSGAPAASGVTGALGMVLAPGTSGGAPQVAGIPASQLYSLGAQGYQAVQGPGGTLTLLPLGSGGGGAAPGYFTALGATPVSDDFRYGLSEAVARTQAASTPSPATLAPSTGQMVGGTAVGAAGVAGSVAGSAGSAAGTSAAAASAATVAQALGAVAAIAGFALSIYGAYQSGSPAYGALAGGLSGAAAGATIGSMYPGIGTAVGAVVGLIAGAAIGAGAGKAGKGGGETSQQRAADAQRVTQQVFASLQGVATRTAFLEARMANGNLAANVLRRLTFQVSARNVGYALAAADVSLAGVLYARLTSWGAEMEDLITVGAMGGVGEWAEWLARTGTLGAGLQQLQQLMDALDQAAAAVGLQYEDGLLGRGPGGGTIRRTTLVPGSMAERLQGRQVTVIRNSLTGLTDDQVEAMLIHMAQVSSDRDLGILTVDPTTGLGLTSFSRAFPAISRTQDLDPILVLNAHWGLSGYESVGDGAPGDGGDAGTPGGTGAPGGDASGSSASA